ncbi:DUF6746 family protein [Arsukibacterium sp.]|uniref:DUF6746 family protein n=1 Tax=Arsukibacterium sp. TaxID=1977258 RepID=UPI002FDB84EC
MPTPQLKNISIRPLALAISITLLSLGFSSTALAERPDHFKGKPADTLQQAVANFQQYNAKLASLLAAELTPERMVEIHQLTYTLENALQKIHAETAALQLVLEEVHVGSEHMDFDKVKSEGQRYLNNAKQLIK